MRIGVTDMEILDLAVQSGGTFNESDLERSNIKRLGVGRLLDALASLKDRGLILLNTDGSFTISGPAREILWSNTVPLRTRILRLLQIRSCSMAEISGILRTSGDIIRQEIEALRMGQFVLMSSRSIDGNISRIFEILPEGAAEIDGTKKQNNAEILSIIEEIREDMRLGKIESASIKLDKLKTRLGI